MPKLSTKKLREKAKNIELIVMDVDGVLTDGRIIYSADGKETKSFDVRDGYGLALAKMAGLDLAWISGRFSEVTAHRASELGIERVYQGEHDKAPVLRKLAEELEIRLENVVFMGDDVIDIPAMEAAGIGVAVADAHPETLAAADWITACKGGQGAVREVIDLVMRAKT